MSGIGGVSAVRAIAPTHVALVNVIEICQVPVAPPDFVRTAR